MKVLSISRQDSEMARQNLNRRSLLIGRSPTCDIVLRGRSIKPVHYLLEWFGEDVFDANKGFWALVDLSETQGNKNQKSALTGEAVLIGPGKVEVAGLHFEIVDDELAESDLRKGAIKRGLTQDEDIATPKELSVLEIVQYRKDIDSVVSVRHVPFTRLSHPLFFEPNSIFSIQKEASQDAIKLVNVKGADFQAYLRTQEVTEQLKEKSKSVLIQPADLLMISTEEDEFYLRMVADAKTQYDKLSTLKDPTLLTFIGVSALLCILAFWTWMFPPKIEEIQVIPPRVATVEVKEVAAPPEEEEPPPPPPPPQVEQVQQPEAPKMKVQTQAPPKPSIGAAAIVKNSKVENKPGLNSPAPVQNINSIGLLGKLGGKRSNQKVSADMVLNQGIVSQTVTGAGGFKVNAPPTGELGVGKNGGGTGGPGLAAASTTLKNSGLGNLKSTGAIGVQGGSEKFSAGQSFSGEEGLGVDRSRSRGDGGSGEEQVSGGLDREAVRRALAENKRAIRNCYEVALISKKDLEGKMTLKWKISPEGPVETISLLKSEIGMPSFEQCVQRVVKGIVFPKAQNKSSTTVIYPFVFQGKK